MSKIVKFFGFTGLMLISSLSYANPKCPNVPASLGQCINVGSYELFMKVQGNKGLTVVFDAGRGDTSDTWNKVIPEVSKFAKTISYDRVNLGYSQSMPDVNKPVTAKLVAENLHTLLHNAKLAPPYILVGHSAGGLYAQMFARLYPKEVLGIVFVDSANTEQIFGNGLPLPDKTNIVYGESLGFISSLQQVKHAPPFPKVPIIVLTATNHGTISAPTIKRPVTMNDGKKVLMTGTEIQTLFERWQNHLAQLSPYSIHIYAYGSGHHIQNDQPDLVIDAIYTLTKQQKRSGSQK